MLKKIFSFIIKLIIIPSSNNDFNKYNSINIYYFLNRLPILLNTNNKIFNFVNKYNFYSKKIELILY